MKYLHYYIIVGIVLLTAAIAFAFKDKTGFRPIEDDIPITYTIDKDWELPEELEEVSGIAWLKDDKIACIQDEDGIIFIYDLNTKKIVDEIGFADAGDYEGIAVKNKNAYVMRSDGKLYEVQNFMEKDEKTNSYQTPFSGKNNMESLTFDTKNNRLLTSPKDRDLDDDDFKGIYQISLSDKKIMPEPIYELDMKSSEFKDFAKKKAYKTFGPSDMAIHPKTGDIYILDGKNPKLLILDPKGNPKKIHLFDEKDFPQPEGITFSPDGKLYISNEANDGAATIFEVTLD